MEKFYDTEFLRRMTEQAYNDVIASGRYSYNVFINEFDDIVSKYGYKCGRRLKIRFGLSRFNIACIMRPKLSSLNTHVITKKHDSKIYFVIYLIFNAVKNPWTLYFKLTRTLKVTLATGVLQKIMAICIKEKKDLKEIKISNVLKELLRIEILRLIILGKLKTEESFYITSYLDGNKLILLSKRKVNSNNEVTYNRKDTFKVKNDLKALKVGLMSKNSKNISSIVWNNSAIGELLFFRGFGSSKLSIYIGAHGLYEFEIISKYIGNYSQALLRYLLNE